MTVPETSDREYFEFDVEADDLKGRPCIYNAIGDSQPPKFGVCIPRSRLNDLAFEDDRDRHPFIWITSKRPPQVIPGAKSLGQLIKQLQGLDAMNQSRDEVFACESLRISGFTVMLRKPGGKVFKSAVLESIEFQTSRCYSYGE